MANCRQWRFPNKLHSLLINGETDVALQWNAEGTAILLDRQALQSFLARMESNPFKTKSVDSFIRQLHLYGFRLITKKGRKQKPSLNANNSLIQDGQGVFEYSHPFFMRSRPDFLDYVQRRTSLKKKTSGRVFKEDNEVAPMFCIKKGNETVSLQRKKDSLEPVEQRQLPSLKSESSSNFYRETPDGSSLHEDAEAASQSQVIDLPVETIPSEEEYLGNFDNLSYSVLQQFDPFDQSNFPQIVPNADRNNIYTFPDLYSGQTALHRDFGEDGMFFPEADPLGHQTTPAFVWQLHSSESFSTQTSETQENLDFFYAQEVEVNSETASGSMSLHLGYE